MGIHADSERAPRPGRKRKFLSLRKSIIIISLIALFPSGLTKEIFAEAQVTDILKFKVVEKKDYSYLNHSRMSYRVTLEIDELQPPEKIEKTLDFIWINETKKCMEFTVFAYLPGMNTYGFAYAISEYGNSIKNSFRINNDVLIGTSWEKKKISALTEKKSIPVPKANIGQKTKYFINLGVLKVKPRRIKINIETNFPDGTELGIGVSRPFRDPGESELAAGVVYNQYIAVSKGKIDVEVDIEDSKWYPYGSVSWVSPELDIDIMMTPLRQSKEILKIIGIDGELMDGLGLEKLKYGFSVFKAMKKIQIPFEK